MNNKHLIILICLIIAAIFTICCNEDTQIRDDNWLARVGNHIIVLDDVQAEINSLMQGNMLPDQNSKELVEVRQSILDELIERELLLLEAERRKIIVSPDEVDERLELTYGSSEADKLNEIEKTTGFDASAVRKRITQTLQVEKLFARDVFPRILMSEEELKKEYQDNLDKYFLPERVKVRQIVVVTEEEATQLMRRIWRGDSFAELASEFSIMPEKSKGGDLGWIKKGEYPSPLNEMFFSLPKRTYNKPVKSEFGYHLIHIMDHKKEQQLEFDDARRLVEKDLFRKKKERARDDLLDNLTKRYKIEINKNISITETKSEKH